MLWCGIIKRIRSKYYQLFRINNHDFHSIKRPFDAEAAEKFLNGVSTTTILEKAQKDHACIQGNRACTEALSNFV